MSQSSENGIFVGIDGGGTHTRVLCTDLSGNPLSYSEGLGANPDHNPNGEANVRECIAKALCDANRQPSDIVAMVGGIAGYDEESLLEPAAERLRLPGVTAPFKVVNDGIVAHAGAFGIASGILHVSGSGSVTTYIDENRNVRRNYDFLQYSHSGGRHLGYAAVFALLGKQITELDQYLLEAALRHFNVDSLDELHALEAKNNMGDYKALLQQHGKFAPMVTDAASKGSPIAQAVCLKAAEEVVQAITLVAPRNRSEESIKIVLHGSVARCNYFRAIIVRLLMNGLAQRFEVVEPKLPPVAGAILLASQEIGWVDLKLLMANLQRRTNESGFKIERGRHTSS